MDGTHVRLARYPSVSELPPGLEPEAFTNRKYYASLNVMAIGDIQGLFRHLEVVHSLKWHCITVEINIKVDEAHFPGKLAW